MCCRCLLWQVEGSGVALWGCLKLVGYGGLMETNGDL